MVKIIPDWQLIHEGLLTMASEVIINVRVLLHITNAQEGDIDCLLIGSR